jgi:hypothetical protein
MVQAVLQGGHDAEISAAAPQRPEQLLFTFGIGDDHASIRQHNLRGEEIIECQPEPADQRAVAAAQGESGHADAAERAGDRCDAQRVRHCDNVRGAGAARNSGGAIVGIDDDAVHSAQIDNDAGA